METMNFHLQIFCGKNILIISTITLI